MIDELPPLPEPHHIGHYGVARYSTCQMEDYATAARAPLLAELAELRSAVRHEADCVEAAKGEIAALRERAESAERGIPMAHLSLNVKHKDCHKAADAFWNYWRENGETHKHGYYESTWGAINQALRTVGVVENEYMKATKAAIDAAIKGKKP